MMLNHHLLGSHKCWGWFLKYYSGLSKYVSTCTRIVILVAMKYNIVHPQAFIYSLNKHPVGHCVSGTVPGTEGTAVPHGRWMLNK